MNINQQKRVKQITQDLQKLVNKHARFGSMHLLHKVIQYYEVKVLPKNDITTKEFVDICKSLGIK